MFDFLKAKKSNSNAQNNENNVYLLKNMKDYNVGFYRFAGSILSENNDAYIKLCDSNFPKFDIVGMVNLFFKDVINSDSPFTYTFSYSYFENIINKEMKNTYAFKCFKLKQISLLKSINPGGKQKDIMFLFNNNLFKFFIKVDEVLKTKIYNNCIANFEDEKYDYGVGTYEEGSYSERQLVNYYFYFMDSVMSAAAIAYLMSISIRINSAKSSRNEFYTIIENMLKETKDIELVYKKGYELLENVYSMDFRYLEDENAFKLFVKMIDSYNFADKDDKTTEYLSKFGALPPSMFLRKAAVDQMYMSDDELKNTIAYLTKNTEHESMEKLFEQLSLSNIYIDNYKKKYRESKVLAEKEKFLKGDFSSLKEEENNKQSLKNIRTGTEFEKYLVKLFKDMGYEAKHTGKAGDQGCDLILKKGDTKYCVQAKYYKTPLDNTPVQEIIGSLKHYDGNRGVVVTNSTFTSGAYELAKSNNVILINGNKLQKLINYLYSENDVNRDILDDIDYL